MVRQSAPQTIARSLIHICNNGISNLPHTPSNTPAPEVLGGRLLCAAPKTISNSNWHPRGQHAEAGQSRVRDPPRNCIVCVSEQHSQAMDDATQKGNLMMVPRYFVTYRHFADGRVERTTTPLGRFWSEAEASQFANSKYVSGASEVLSVQQETALQSILHKVARVVIRTSRIALAAAIAVVAYGWLSTNQSLGDIPLSQLTGNMIFSLLYRTAMATGAVWLCGVIAFGDAPTDSPFA